MRPLQLFITLSVILLCLVGCSKGGKDPISGDIQAPKMDDTLESIPIVGFDGTTALGLLGAYNLVISPDNANAELTSMRTNALGESFVVSGGAYFTTRPCVDCLRVSYIGLTSSGEIALGFWIKHPFPKGDPVLPPSGKNRLDLDLFDVALMVKPIGATPSSYNLMQVNAYTGIILNADGYSADLSGVTADNAILPYKICYEKRGYNRFEMGTYDYYFYLIFNEGQTQFNLYLTMGYGASATLPDRLNPIYYIPEFNRKAAWKIKIEPQIWYGGDPATVTIDIFDWNHGGTVADTFPDSAHINYLKASSDIASVTVEVPGMTDTIITAATTDTHTNGWDDPITYTATFANENNLPQGDYIGLVKALDSRIPGTGLEGDSLIHSPEGTQLQMFDLTEFATYQTFTATIAPPCGPITGQVVSPSCPISGVKDDETIDFVVSASSANNGNPIVLYEADWDYDGVTFDVDASSTTGSFEGCGPFINPNCPDPIPVTYTVAFRAKDSCLHPNVTVFATCDVTVDICCGPITGDVVSPSCPISGIANHQTIDFVVSASSANGGNPITQYQVDRDYDGANFDIDATSPNGVFDNVGPFDNPNCPGSGDPATLTVAFAATDSCNPPNTTVFATCEVTVDICAGWALTWGGNGPDEGRCVAKDSLGKIYVAGNFSGTVDLDPSDAEDQHISTGLEDIFLCRFNSLGVFEWGLSWGGTLSDIVRDIFIDSSGNVFLTGNFSGTSDFDPDTAIDNHISVGDTPDIFISKFDSTGDFQWARTWGGDSVDSGNGICVNNSQNIYVVGYFDSTVNFDPGGGPFNLTSAGLSDIFLSKFDSGGNFVTAFKLGSWGIDEAEEIVADGSGNVVVAGEFMARFDFDPGSGADEHQSVDGYDTFLAKYDANLNYVWALSWGSFGDSKGLGLSLGPSDNLFVTGFFQETVDFDPDPATIVEVTSNGNSDAFLSLFNSSGDFLQVLTWGGSNIDEAHDIVVGTTHFAVVGSFDGSGVDFNPGSGSETHSSNGSFDAFASKFNLTGNEFVGTITWGGTQADEGWGVAFDALGYVLATGEFRDDVDFDPGPWTDQRSSNGDSDVYLVNLVL